MIGTLVRLELRRSRGVIVWISVAALAYGAVIAMFYPVMRDNAKLIDEYMAVFPSGVLAAFGMEGSLSDYGVFFNTYIGSMLWPVLAAIAGILVATRPVASDLDRGFLELPLATPVDRPRYLLSAIAGQVVVLAVIAVAVVAGLLVVGPIVGAGFDTGRFLMELPLLFAFGAAVAAIATLLSVVTLSRAVSGGIVAGGLLAMYLFDAISKIARDFEWLGTLSAFRYLRSTEAIDGGRLPGPEILLFVVVAAAAWFLAVALFRRRDLVA